MQVSVEKISAILRRLTITVPHTEYDAAFKKQINDIAKKANIKGFRPGKVPLTYVKQRFGEEAKQKALTEIIQNALYQAIQEHQLKPVHVPKIETKPIETDKPLEFVASFEIFPHIEKINFSLDQLDKPEVEIKEDDIDRVIKQLLKQYTEWKLAEREAKNEDRVVVDYYGVFEGDSEAQNKTENYAILLGSKTMLPGFEEGLIGTKAGEEKLLKLTFPEDFTDKAKAGKPVEFVVQIKQVFEPEVPACDEIFIKKLGIPSGQESDLKNQIKQTLELERDRLVQEKLKEQIFNHLLEQNPIEVPESLITSEAKNIHNELYPQHTNKKHEHTQGELAVFQNVAKKRVALGMLIAEYAKQANLTLDQAKLHTRIKEIASSYEHPEEVEKWLLSDETRRGIEAQVMEDQVTETLISGAQVTPKPMSYAELKGIRI